MSCATDEEGLRAPVAAWAEQIPEEQWSVYREVIAEATIRGIPFLLGGGFAFAAYTDRWRNTKDIDLIVLPRDRDAMIELLLELGLLDYHDQVPYERHWIYRAVAHDTIVDVIWQMANRRAPVDQSWFHHARTVCLRGTEVRVLGPEELVWSKIYVMKSDRCDWPDLLNILHATGPGLVWELLLQHLREDAPLLAAVLSVFGWLCPARAGQLPAGVWERLRIPEPALGPPCTEDHWRVDLLDTRDWFGPTLLPGEPLRV
jgi:hypothetical protein